VGVAPFADEVTIPSEAMLVPDTENKLAPADPVVEIPSCAPKSRSKVSLTTTMRASIST